jgi:sulfide dehydrogenase cytochrome subunit
MTFLTKQLGGGLAMIALLATCAAGAVTVSPAVVTLVAGTSRTVAIAQVTGRLSLVNSNPAAVTVSRVDSSSFRLTARALGASVVQFKDSGSTAGVSVTVTLPASGQPAGRLLASNCFQCHGTNGSGGFDRLSGKNANEIYDELREFASGQEDANGIMAAHAMGFSDAQLRSIASYFASLR